MIKKIYCIILDAKNFFLSRKMISKVLSFLIFQNYLEIKYMTNRKWKNCVKNELNKMCNMLKWSTMEGDDNHERFLYIMCESFLLAHSHRILVSPWNYPMGIVHGGCLGKKTGCYSEKGVPEEMVSRSERIQSKWRNLS